MNMTVYLDVLLLSNLWVDHALLRTAAALTHSPMTGLRGLCGAAVGAAGSLIILLPEMPDAVCLLLRAALTLIMCAAAYGYRHLLKQTTVLLLLSAAFCGAVYALGSMLHPAGFYANNAVIYADISLTVLLLGTGAAAAVTTLLQRHAEAKPADGLLLHLRVGQSDCILPALADTGSTLRDPCSGRPAAVCAGAALGALISGNTADAVASQKGFRMIPVQTVTGMKLLPAFQPEYAAVRRGGSAQETPLDILIAVSDASAADTPAILPAGILHAVSARTICADRQHFRRHGRAD